RTPRDKQWFGGAKKTELGHHEHERRRRRSDPLRATGHYHRLRAWRAGGLVFRVRGGVDGRPNPYLVRVSSAKGINLWRVLGGQRGRIGRSALRSASPARL